MNNIAEMSRGEKVMLYTIGLLEDLKSKGMISGGTHQISFKGDQAHAELLASGFKPTQYELLECVDFLAKRATP